MISAEIIADSLGGNGCRLTTFVLKFPRIVLAEFNTHRMISKNSASSRAIPFKKMLEMVQENPFIPLGFQADHKGMQGTVYLEGEELENARTNWLLSRDAAVIHATRLNDMGVTKQLCNRLLEPFLYHTVIATGTDWENFFALRAHPAAEIHIADLAHKMLGVYNNSEPNRMMIGDYHIPFGDKIDDERVRDIVIEQNRDVGVIDGYTQERQVKTKIATARCARVSYMNFEGKDDYEADIKLHDDLASMGHWSPFEHCARYKGTQEFYGNFKGFMQYRKTFLGENQTDYRVKKYQSHE